MKNYLFSLCSLLLAALCSAVAQTPVVSYHFEGGAPTDDDQTYTGTLENGAAIVRMSDGNHTLQLGSDNGYLDLGSAFGGSVLGRLGSHYTITCNVLVSAESNLLQQDGNFLFCLGTQPPVSTPTDYFMMRLRNGVVGYTFRYSGVNYRGSAALSITPGRWQTLTYVRNGTTGTFYLNGAVGYTETLSGNGALTPAQAVAAGRNYRYNYIGRSTWQANVYLQNSWVDNFAIYDEALTAEAVQALHAAAAELSTTPQAVSFTTDRYRLLRTALSLAAQVAGVRSDGTLPAAAATLRDSALHLVESGTGALPQTDTLAHRLYRALRPYLDGAALSAAPARGFDLTAALRNPFFVADTARIATGSLPVGWQGSGSMASTAGATDGYRDAYLRSYRQKLRCLQIVSGLPRGYYRIEAMGLRANRGVQKSLVAEADSLRRSVLLPVGSAWADLQADDSLNVCLDSVAVSDGRLTVGFVGDDSNNTSYADAVRLYLVAPLPEGYVPPRRGDDTLLPTPEILPTQEEVVSLISRVANSWMKRHSSLGSFVWNHAVYMNGNMEAYRYVLPHNQRLALNLRDYALRWSYDNNWAGSSASISEAARWTYRGSSSSYDVLFGDNQICFQTYVDLFQTYDRAMDSDWLIDKNGDGTTDSLDMIYRAQEVMNYQLTTTVTDYWWWTDALYMMLPTMSRLYLLTGNKAFLNKTHDYLEYTRAHMYDEENHLFYRDARYVYPTHTTPCGLPNYWSRGEGWAVAGLARCLDQLAPTDPHYDYLMQLYLDNINTLVAWQQVDSAGNGYWTQSVCDPTYVPGYETSGTVLNVYALLIGLRNGWLDEAAYFRYVKRGWDYLMNVALQQTDGSNIFVGYAQPQGAAATTATPASSEQDFATGAFLECAAEMGRYGDLLRARAEPVAIAAPRAATAEPVNVYDLEGRLLRSRVPRAEATRGLPRGLYIVGGRKQWVR